MKEQSGSLAPAVERYLRHEPLSPQDISLLRAYIRQWIMSPSWDLNPHPSADDLLKPLRDMVDSLTSRKQIDLWTKRAIDAGVDPW